MTPPSTPRPTLYLIDGYAQFFRAYHAIRTPMTSPVTKEPTNMTFGFLGMLLKLLKAEGRNLKRAGSPTHIALVLDVSGDQGTFRSRLYPEYKATRKPPPEDLFPQVRRCIAMLKEVGMPVLGAEGFEADDVIAALVHQYRARHKDVAIRIISKDKDLKQLLEGTDDPAPEDAPIADPVIIFDVHTDAPFTAHTLKADTGLAPSQVVDMLTLMGDTVDNVPGVPGVGEKTAAQLIRDFGSVDALLARATEVPGKRGEALRATAPALALSKRLVTLDHGAPASLELKDADVTAMHWDRLIPICKELGFNRYQDEVRALTRNPAGNPAAAQQMPLSVFDAPAPRKPQPAAPPPGAGLFDSLDAPREVKQAQSGSYRCITTRKQLDALMKECRAAPIIAIDTETTSLCPRDAKLCGVSISTAPGTAAYIPTRSPTPDKHLATEEVLAALKPLLEDPAIPKCGHNLKYDILIFRAHGVHVALRPPDAHAGELSFDSMVASYLIDASRSSHSLDALALALLNRTNISITELIGSGKEQRTFDTVPTDQATQYAAEDADVALQLRNTMLPQLRAMELLPLFRDVEMPLVEALAELEWNGILVDPAELDRQRERIQKEIDNLLAQISHASRAALGRTFEPDSPRQLATVLFNKDSDEPPGLGLKSVKKTKTGHSTDAEVLETLAEDPAVTTPIPRLILEYRQLAKLVSTYLVALKDAIHPATHRIHSSFHQTVAATGRLASSDPNLQNIPIRTDVGRDIRRAFIAPPGRVLVTADYSQIELRLLAHLSRDPALIQAFQQGEDIHTAVAAQIASKDPKDVTREERSGAKMVNFGIVYGITAFGLARRLKIDQAKAAQIIDGYKRRFAGITTFLQECVAQAQAKGYVTTILGRRRPIPDIESTNPSRRALAERLAINSVVQGSAADLIKLAMVQIESDLERARSLPATARAAKDHALAQTLMLLQIHDELVFEAPQEHAQAVQAFVTHRMENAMALLVPLKADSSIGKNWYEGK
ncbi:MAG: DNA polymerase I [Phycisphaerales bacterium]